MMEELELRERHKSDTVRQQIEAIMEEVKQKEQEQGAAEAAAAASAAAGSRESKRRWGWPFR